jgi:hypothetical protein
MFCGKAPGNMSYIFRRFSKNSIFKDVKGLSFDLKKSFGSLNLKYRTLVQAFSPSAKPHFSKLLF